MEVMIRIGCLRGGDRFWNSHFVKGAEEGNLGMTGSWESRTEAAQWAPVLPDLVIASFFSCAERPVECPEGRWD